MEFPGTTLSIVAMPRYAEALMSRRVVMAHDARTAPETSELTAGYLIPNRITSMLDAPIYRFGEVVGVVCHEHVGEPRTWTVRERDFASSVADIVAVLLEQATRMDGEEALRVQRLRAEKLERAASLVRFAAGIAHDFNNVLSALMMQLELLRERVGQDLRSDVDELSGFAETGRNIVAQLLAYCKEAPFEPRAVNLAKLLADKRKLLEAIAGNRHRVVLTVSAERMIAHVDPTQIDQLILNLVTNAREAMPDGGEIGVSLDAMPDWVVLSVRDRGVGIDESVRERIFEPFFTTKGAGTGLGLSIVHSIVQQHGGELEVQSIRDGGTMFVVRLPSIAG